MQRADFASLYPAFDEKNVKKFVALVTKSLSFASLTNESAFLGLSAKDGGANLRRWVSTAIERKRTTAQ